METNESKVKNGRVLSMFMAIRNAELKNVRTLEHDDKDMVKRIRAYIRNEANRPPQGEGDD